MIKTFNIDWDDLAAVKQMQNVLKCRIGELLPGLSRRDRFNIITDSINKIYNTDISEIYEDLSSTGDNKFYVYAHCDSSRKIAIGKSPYTTFAATLGMCFQPFYIGKGIGNRCEYLQRNKVYAQVKQRAEKFGDGVTIFKIKTDLSENDALALESKLIDIFGLFNNSYGRRGCLANLDEGHHSDKRRTMYIKDYQKISDRNGVR